MPKAAVMKHFRYYSMVVGAAKSFRVYPSDRIYVSMPIYHTAAGILGKTSPWNYQKWDRNRTDRRQGGQLRHQEEILGQQLLEGLCQVRLHRE